MHKKIEKNHNAVSVGRILVSDIVPTFSGCLKRSHHHETIRITATTPRRIAANQPAIRGGKRARIRFGRQRSGQ